MPDTMGMPDSFEEHDTAALSAEAQADKQDVTAETRARLDALRKQIPDLKAA